MHLIERSETGKTATENIISPLIKNDFIYLSAIGTVCDTDKTFLSGDYTIIYVKRGGGLVVGKTHTFSLNPGDAFAIFPGLEISMISNSSESFQYGYFSFGGPFAERIISETVFEEALRPYQIANAAVFETICYSHLNPCESGSISFSNLEKIFKLMQFFSKKNLSTAFGTSNESYIEYAQNYLQSNYTKDIKINDLAKTINISRSYLYRIFTQQTGQSPVEYLTSIRIESAKNLLATTNMSLGLIAENTGYNNYSVFFAAFHDYTGLSPKEYRLLKATDTDCTSNIRISIFTTLKECESLNRISTPNLTVSFDEFFTGKPLNGHYIKQLLDGSYRSFFFAYDFKSEDDAKSYFLQFLRKPHTKEKGNFGFKIIKDNNLTQLIVWKEAKAYRIMAKDAKTLNHFRIFMNDYFSTTIITE